LTQFCHTHLQPFALGVTRAVNFWQSASLFGLLPASSNARRPAAVKSRSFASSIADVRFLRRSKNSQWRSLRLRSPEATEANETGQLHRCRELCAARNPNPKTTISKHRARIPL
jgi:hypothetical protein